MDPVDLPDYRKKKEATDEGGDARTLLILRKDGKRQRDFKEGGSLMSKVSFDDWRVSGPRAAKWCLEFLAKKNGPLSHHEWWKSVTKLSSPDYGVSEHEMIMRAVQDALEYDEVDLVNLTIGEHMLRRGQLIEYFHREKARQEVSMSGGSASEKGRATIEVEEQDAFLGTSGLSGALMISPDLVQHVSRELERQAAIDKQARKAREERALRRK